MLETYYCKMIVYFYHEKCTRHIFGYIYWKCLTYALFLFTDIQGLYLNYKKYGDILNVIFVFCYVKNMSNDVFSYVTYVQNMYQIIQKTEKLCSLIQTLTHIKKLSLNRSPEREHE